MGAQPHTSTFMVDLRDIDVCNAAMVDALARLALTLRECGRRLEIRNARADLVDLICFMGLRDAVSVVEA